MGYKEVLMYKGDLSDTRKCHRTVGGVTEEDIDIPNIYILLKIDSFEIRD